MILRPLNEKQFEYFQNLLISNAMHEPLDADFHMPIRVNETEYMLRIQPCSKRKFAVLQALEVRWNAEKEISQILITDNKILLALFELLLFQGMA